MKFSIITPSYNCGLYITETIESVLSQAGNFEIEYIIMDGGSNDNSIDVIKKYEQLLKEKRYPIRCLGITFVWRSEKDHGMYDAINKGFGRATGEIYAWLNADDVYEPNALQTIQEIFSAFPEIEWAKGINSNIEADGEFIKNNHLRIYHQSWLQKGIYGRVAYFIEQDTVFWRNSLWKKTGPIPKQYKYAGDYWLWVNFAKYAKLWSCNKKVSVFRKRKEQMSQQMNMYQQEQQEIVPHMPSHAFIIRTFFNLEKRFGHRFKNFFIILYRLLFSKNTNEFYIESTHSGHVKKPLNYFRV